ncbi:MAG TPA: hypothetical protein DF383_10795 [Deltaproteobacteria bacterium]|nr:hypothetical protein [Deltaproteobacteria bacterium]
MQRAFVFFLMTMFLVSGCGSAPKRAKVKHSKKKHSDLAYESGTRSHSSRVVMGEDDSQALEDILYDSLGHKQGSGVKYSRVYGEDGKFDIPITHNGRVQKWLDYFTGPGRRHYERYLSRSARFIPYMHAVLKKYGVPKDLVYLSMIESGFNTRAASWASAVGPWQFIKSTGAMYGLNVDYYVDERRDIEKATHAAASHLRDLYNEFGDWYLAFAAYNAGAGKIRNAINRNGNNFWDMADGNYLRQETKDYVPKLLAAAIIGKNPAKYGFRNVEYQLPIDYEKVKMSSATDLEVAAECAGVDADLVRLLNPELLQDMTPPQIPGYMLKIPRGTRERFQRKYAGLSPAQRMRSTEYVVRKGDSLSEIAGRFGVSEAQVAKANSGDIEIRRSKRSERVKVSGRKGRAKWEKRTYTVASYEVRPGSRLTIPRGRSDRTDSSRDDAAAHAAKSRFGISLARLEGPSEKGRKKKASKEDLKFKERPEDKKTLIAKNTSTAPAAEVAPAPVPVRDDLSAEGDPEAGAAEVPAASKPNLEILADSRAVSEKEDANRGTPLAFNNRPEGAMPPPGTGPSDAQLRDAVQSVASMGQDSDLAVQPESSSPASREVESRAKPKTAFYTVKRGDTLIKIAARQGVTVEELKRWNGKKVAGGLLAGSKLVVSSKAASPAVKSSSKTAKSNTKVVKYKVKPGDNLIKIAKRHDTTPSALLKLNGMKTHKIIPGTMLIVRRGGR